MKRSKPKLDRLTPRKVVVKGKPYWQVDLGIVQKDGRAHRQRRTFADHQEAETFARLKMIELQNRGVMGINLSERSRAQAIECEQLLAPYPEVSMVDVVRDYIRRRQSVEKSETTAVAFESFMTARTNDGLRPRYLGDLRIRVGRFVEAFRERRLSDITAAELDRYLRDLGVAPLTRNSHRMRLSVFFEFARQRGWVRTNPLVDVSKAKVTAGVPGILSVEQAARLLESASFETLPFFAIGLFAGLRSAELERVEWHRVKWDERLIEVPALSSKTAARRLVVVQDNLMQWLAPYRGQQGKISPSNLARRLLVDRHRAGITDWPSNALRHSFASYHLALFKDAPALSLELGHTSPRVVFAHYREVVTPAEAERFWKIVPAVHAESIAVVA